MARAGLLSAASAKASVPRHVGIIPDGNGRWARARGLPRIAGHTVGADVTLRTVRDLFERGVEVISLFALSTENVQGRDPAEVAHIVQLIATLLHTHADDLADRGIAVQVVSSAACSHMLDQLAQPLAQLGQRAAARTAQAQPDSHRTVPASPVESWAASSAGQGTVAPRTLCLAVGYGGRADIVGAATELVRKALAGTLEGGASSLDETMMAEHLATGLASRHRLCSAGPTARALPDVDLLIRTSGEHRLSNFLLWHCAYAELHFSQALWPDFGVEELEVALRQFSDADRRFGRVETREQSTRLASLDAGAAE